MKTLLFSALAATAGIVLSSCDKADISSSTAPAKGAQVSKTAEPQPVTTAESGSESEPSEAEKKLASQVQELEARELALQQQLEDERLAAADAEIAKEQELLQKEREAWALEQQLAEAKTDAEAPPAEVSPVEDVSTNSFATNDYQTFYNDLDPLGSWYESPDYGYVWQPAVAISDTGWRPYTRGRWACADQGWTWCSDEPFGWACYHYGRWCKVRGRGWVWVPGDQWAPAWVCWRKTDSYIGWCPLPPETVYNHDCTYGSTVDIDCGIHPSCYVFMPVRHFDKPVFSYCEVPSVCLTIYNGSVNITNCVIRRHRVECHGPQYQWITDSVRHPVPRYVLAWEANRPDRRHTPVFEKDKLSFFAPKVYAPWNLSLHPSRARASIASADIERGDGGVPAKLSTRFKEERLQREKAVENLPGTAGRKIMEHQQRLAALEKSKGTLQQQISQETVTARPNGAFVVPGRQTAGDAPGPSGRPSKQAATASTDVTANSKPAISADIKKDPVPRAGGTAARITENPQLTAAREELARLRAQREAKQPAFRPDAAPVNPGAATIAENNGPRRIADTREEIDGRKEQLAKLRAEREAAAAKQGRQPSAGIPDNNSKEKIADSAARLRDDAAREQAAQNDRTKDQLAKQRTALEEQRQKNEAANRELDRQNAERAALEDSRRLQQETQNRNTKEQLAKQRADLEQQRRAADAASREAERQKTERAALEEKRRQQQEAAQQQARAELAQQRAALEQQRRQAEEQAKADRLAREQAAAQQREALQREAIQREAQQREALQHQAAEQAARQREAVDNQRRQAEEQSRQETARRQAEDNSRRQAEESNRRQAEENSRKQAEESRRQADQRAKDAADQNNKRGK
jgi:hypothetical protein